MASLIRLSDGAGESGARSEAIKWNDDGSYDKIAGHKPIIGCSMLVGAVTARSYSYQDWWLTSVVTEVIEETDDYVKFKTNNSIYEWRI